MTSSTLTVNRAPVMTLWAAVVAERLGYHRDEALTLGRAVAGLNAQTKGRRLGIFEPGSEGASKAHAKKKAEERRREHADVLLLHRAVPVVRTPKGLRAKDRERVVEPEAVERYLESKFGEHLAAAREAMEELAASLTPRALAEEAYDLYEAFRPAIPPGKRGWGAAGVLDLAQIRAMARRA